MNERLMMNKGTVIDFKYCQKEYEPQLCNIHISTLRLQYDFLMNK